MTCRFPVGQRRRASPEPSAAEVVILAWLHVGGEIRPNPAAVAIDNSLFLEFANRSFPSLDCRRVMRILGGLLIPDLGDGNRLHCFDFTSSGALAQGLERTNPGPGVRLRLLL